MAYVTDILDDEIAVAADIVVALGIVVTDTELDTTDVKLSFTATITTVYVVPGLNPDIVAGLLVAVDDITVVPVVAVSV
jgi:hypothetical protein